MRQHIAGRFTLGLSLLVVLAGVAPAAADQVTFQQGASGYAGTQDTYVSSGSPNNSYGTATTIQVDTSPLLHGLLRFENIIGNGAGQIPPGATVNSATLTIEVTNRTSSSATLSFHRMLATWSESSTWNSLSNGIQTDNVEALASADVQATGLGSTGTYVLTGFETAIQAWVDGNANHGWALLLNSTNGLDFVSSESGSASLRPLLTVDFTPPAGNTAPYVVSAIPDTSVVENQGAIPKFRDLNKVFSDAQQGSALIFAELSNTNPGLVTTTFDADSALGLKFVANKNGTATITIRAYDSEFLFADDTFTVTVIPLAEVPMIVSAIPDTVVLVDSAPVQDYRDLNDVFFDNADGSALNFTIRSNSNPSVVSVAIDAGDALDLSFAPGLSGGADIVVRATDSDGYWREDTFNVLVTTVSGFGDGHTPEKSRLMQNYPNPFNPTTTIDYEVARAGAVSLRVYDATGRRVRTLFEGTRTPGRWSAEWDGRDESGRPVASGVYFYRLSASDLLTTKKMVLLK